MGVHYDEETGIVTEYLLSIEGVEVDFNNGCNSGGTVSLYAQAPWTSGKGQLLYSTIDCPLRWTPPEPEFFEGSIIIEHLEDGHMCREVLATEKEAEEIASRVAYDELRVTHIAIPHPLSVGTSTVRIEVTQHRGYYKSFGFDISFCVKFRNPEECIRFLDEDMGKLKYRYIDRKETNVTVIDDIIRTLLPIRDDVLSAHKDAAQRGLPLSRFQDVYPQPGTQLIHPRASNRDDRPCYVMLHVNFNNSSVFPIDHVNWSAINNSPAFPLRSDTLRSLNSLHLNFLSPASQDRDHSSSSQSDQGDLTITISAREISFSRSTESASLRNGFTLSSEHRNVTVNHINTISGDVFTGPISRSNIGGTNTANTIRISSPVGSRSPRLTWSRPRSRHTPLQPEQAESQGGVGRWAQRRSPRPRPYWNTHLRSHMPQSSYRTSDKRMRGC